MAADTVGTRIGRIEGALKHLATKADVQAIGWKMAGLFILQTGVLIGAMVAIIKVL